MLTQQLAKAVLEARDIPADALAAARHACIDTVGVALAGVPEDCAVISRRWVEQAGGTPVATVWGTGLRTSPMEAAFTNGIAAHALDFDDSLPTLRGHPSATLVPAMFAAAEITQASGKAVLEAYVVGAEIAGLLGRAVGAGHYMRGWHTTATVGIMSTTAAVARLLGLTVEQLQHAWGIAASETSGLVCNFGTMTKPFHAGHAARCAMVAATLAHSGFTANSAIFDGGQNFFSTYAGEDGEPLAELVGGFGPPWQVLSPSIYVKRWPCCYCNHRPVGGLLKIAAAHEIRIDDVTQIRIGFLPGSDTALVSTDPHTGLEGKFSIEYCAAATLLDGKLTLDSFTDAMVQRPQIRALMKKVKRERIEAEGTFSGAVGYADVSVETTRGNFQLRVDKTPGSPEWPMTPADLAEKFLDCAARTLGAQAAARLLAALEQLDTLPDARQAMQLAAPQTAAVRVPAGT